MVSVIVCPNKTKKGERIIQAWVPDLVVIRFPKCIATKIAEENKTDISVEPTHW